MNENIDTEISPPEALEADEKQQGAVKPRKRFGLPVVLLTAFLAAAFGAGGTYFAAESLKAPPPTADLAPLTARIDTLSEDNKTLKAQLTRLQRDVKAASKPLPKPVKVDLSGIETRLKKLETAKPQSLDPELIARLEALNETGSDALDLSDILERIDALEARPAQIIEVPVATPAAAADAEPLAVMNISFPKADILAVLDKADKSQGWLKRSLNKHISVQSEDNPRYLVEVVAENIEVGNLDAAITAFDKLPLEAKAAANEWRNTVESN